MNRWLRIGGWTLLGLVLLWVSLQLVRMVLNFVSWVITTVISLLIVALVLYLAYLAVTKLTDRGGSSTSTQSRERIFE